MMDMVTSPHPLELAHMSPIHTAKEPSSLIVSECLLWTIMCCSHHCRLLPTQPCHKGPHQMWNTFLASQIHVTFSIPIWLLWIWLSMQNFTCWSASSARRPLLLQQQKPTLLTNIQSSCPNSLWNTFKQLSQSYSLHHCSPPTSQDQGPLYMVLLSVMHLHVHTVQ